MKPLPIPRWVPFSSRFARAATAEAAAREHAAAGPARQRLPPPITLLPRSSALACALVAAYVVLLPVACWPTGGDHDLPRLVAVLAAPWLAWPAFRRSILGWGPGAVRRICWRPDGQFDLDLNGGFADTAVPGPATLALGGAVWLVLRGRRRYYVLVTRSTAGSAEFSALRRRLRCLPGPARPVMR